MASRKVSSSSSVVGRSGSVRVTSSNTLAAPSPVRRRNSSGNPACGLSRKGSDLSTASAGAGNSGAVRRSNSAVCSASCCLKRKKSSRCTNISRKTSSCSTTSCGSGAREHAAPAPAPVPTRKTSSTSTTSGLSTGSGSSSGAAGPGDERPEAREVLVRRLVQEGAARGSVPSGAFLRELACRRRLGSHPHLAAWYLPSCEAPSAWELAQEAAPCGSLYGQLGRRGLGEAAAKQVVRQVAAALQHVHGRGFVHRDVCTDSVLVFQRQPWRVKLGDLGRTCREDALVKKGAARGPWAPPEVTNVLPQEGYHAHASQDAWQLGVLVVACLTGGLPWAAAEASDRQYSAWAAWVRRASPRLPPRFRGFTPRLLRLLRRLLQPRPEQRAGVQEVEKYLSDAWLLDAKSRPSAAGLEDQARALLARAGGKVAELLRPLLPAPRTEDPREPQQPKEPQQPVRRVSFINEGDP